VCISSTIFSRHLLRPKIGGRHKLEKITNVLAGLSHFVPFVHSAERGESWLVSLSSRHNNQVAPAVSRCKMFWHVKGMRWNASERPVVSAVFLMPWTHLLEIADSASHFIPTCRSLFISSHLCLLSHSFIIFSPAQHFRVGLRMAAVLLVTDWTKALARYFLKEESNNLTL
jgi:hypothetical protein